ncbi:hypothetical protein OGAPHI_005864 [Ogataea philodendri]|uniref:ER membrane protein complex subunit 5 n=1 Tax=Ogataea philodendri TaxID=1378263 RepID=A0A9P8NZU5_9ASCO|nr:uncharacterized protein OGAPHI_005864 [Ogataea philodendri]KAH3662612.1 hypothetical protein OGAPHI_005864 [Ogataea philodendri]
MFSSVCFVLAVVLFANSAYSSYQFHQLGNALPLDVQLEAGAACLLALIGGLLAVPRASIKHDIVSGHAVPGYRQEPLKYIYMDKATSELEAQGVGLFEELINRPGYLDLDKKRKEFAKWAKQ